MPYIFINLGFMKLYDRAWFSSLSLSISVYIHDFPVTSFQDTSVTIAGADAIFYSGHRDMDRELLRSLKGNEAGG